MLYYWAFCLRLGTSSHKNIGTHRITVTAKEAESGLKSSTVFQITVQKNEYPVSMDLQNLKYSANDFIYFYKNEADCKNPKAKSIDSLFFTEAYLSKYRAKETYWAKVSGKNQLSNCARGIVQNEILIYNLSRITRPKDKIIMGF